MLLMHVPRPGLLQHMSDAEREVLTAAEGISIAQDAGQGDGVSPCTLKEGREQLLQHVHF